VNKDLSIANDFYKMYYMKIFNDILYVLLDKSHSDGLKLQRHILRLLIQVLDHVTRP
jgi:hypothetical protein